MAVSNDRNLGALAVAQGYITQAQVYECLELQERYAAAGGPMPSLAELLVMRGYIDSQVVEQLQRHLQQRQQEHELFGKIAIRLKWCTKEQVEYCLAVQKQEDQQGHPHKRIGQILVDYGYLATDHITHILSVQKQTVMTCISCGKRFLVPPYRPGTHVQCPSCGMVNVVGGLQAAPPPHPSKSLNAAPGRASNGNGKRNDGGIVVYRNKHRASGNVEAHPGGGRARRVKKLMRVDPSTAPAGSAAPRPSLHGRGHVGALPISGRSAHAGQQHVPIIHSAKVAKSAGDGRGTGGADVPVKKRLYRRLRSAVGEDSGSVTAPSSGQQTESMVASEAPSIVTASAIALEPPPEKPASVTTFELSQYNILRKLLDDGIYKRYLAQHKVSGEKVEVLLLDVSVTFDRAFLNRWLATAKRAIMIDHPFIRKMLHAGTDSTGKTFALLEYLKGQTIREMLDDFGLFPLREAFNNLWLICQGMRHVHELGLFHGNLRPDNIIIGEDGHPHISDLGLVTNFELAISAEVARNRGREVPLYMPPELAVTGQRPDQRSDIYSMGALFYNMITGHAPIVGDNPSAVLMYSSEENVVVPSEINQGIPRFVDRMVMKMIATEPSMRYQSMLQLSQDIQKVRQAIERGVHRSEAIQLGQGEVGRKVDMRERARQVALAKAKARRRQLKKAGKAQRRPRRAKAALKPTDHISETQDMPRVDQDIYGREIVSARGRPRRQKRTEWGYSESEAAPDKSSIGAILTLCAVLFACLVAVDVAFRNKPSRYFRGKAGELYGKIAAKWRPGKTLETGRKNKETFSPAIPPELPTKQGVEKRIGVGGKRFENIGQAAAGPKGTKPQPLKTDGMIESANAQAGGGGPEDDKEFKPPPAATPERRMLDEATLAYTRGKIDKSVDKLRQLIELYPNTKEGMLAKNRLRSYATDAFSNAMKNLEDDLPDFFAKNDFKSAMMESENIIERYPEAYELEVKSSRERVLGAIAKEERAAARKLDAEVEALAGIPVEETDLDKITVMEKKIEHLAPEFDDTYGVVFKKQRDKLSAVRAGWKEYRRIENEKNRQVEELRARNAAAPKNLENLRKRFITVVKTWDTAKASEIVESDKERAKFKDTMLAPNYEQLLEDANALAKLKGTLIAVINSPRGRLRNEIIEFDNSPAKMAGASDENIRIQLPRQGVLVQPWTVLRSFDIDKLCRKVLNEKKPEDLRLLGILHFCLENYPLARNAFTQAAMKDPLLDIEPWRTDLKVILEGGKAAETPRIPENLTAEPGKEKITLKFKSKAQIEQDWTLEAYDSSVTAAGVLVLKPTEGETKKAKALYPLPENVKEIIIRLKIGDLSTYYLLAAGNLYFTLYPDHEKIKCNSGKENSKIVDMKLKTDEWYELKITFREDGKARFIVDNAPVAELPIKPIQGRFLIKTFGVGALEIESVDFVVNPH